MSGLRRNGGTQRGTGDVNNLKGSNGRPFAAGRSGNERGIPRAVIEMRRVIPAMISDLTHGGADLVYMLFRIAAGAEPGMEDSKSRCWAIRELLDRGIGRPAMSLTVETGPRTDLPQLDDRNLTDEELRVLSKIGAAPAKVLQLVPVPAIATEVRPDGDGGGTG